MSGDYQLEDTVYLPFSTRAFATGIPTALVSGEVQIYEDSSITQITAAETLTVSLDGIAGFNMIAVAATGANGFGTGQSYTCILSAGTVDSVSVIGEVVAHFTIEMSAAALDLANGTDGLGAIKGDTANILTDTADIQPNYATEAKQDTAQSDLDIITDTDGVILGAAGVDLILDEVNTVGAHNVNNSLGKQIREGTASLVISSGDCPTSGSHTTSQVVLKASENATDDVYNFKRLQVTAGTNLGFDAIVTDYDGTGKICTISPAFPAACDNTTDYEIVAAMTHSGVNRYRTIRRRYNIQSD